MCGMVDPSASRSARVLCAGYTKMKYEIETSKEEIKVKYKCLI